MEPVHVLRESVAANDLGKLQGNEIIFGGGVKFPKDTITAFREKKGKGKPYTLDTIWYCLKNESIPHAQYVSACLANHIHMVSLVDKGEIIAYLKGSAQTAPQLDETIDFSLSTTGAPSDRLSASSEFQESANVLSESADTQNSKDISVGSEIPSGSDTTSSSQSQPQLLEQQQSQQLSQQQGVTGDSSLLLEQQQEQQQQPKDLQTFSEESGIDLAHLASLRSKIAKRKTPGTISEEKSAEIQRQKAFTEITLREKASLTTLSSMQCKRKDFSKILDRVREIQNKDREKEEEQKRQQQQQQQARKQKQKEEQSKKAQPTVNIGGLNIDMDGSFITQNAPDIMSLISATSANSGNSSSSSSSSSQQPPQSQNKQPEREEQTKKRKREDDSNHKSSRHKSEHSGGSGNSHHRSQKKQKPPIIIVPASPTSLVTLYNVSEFLCDGKIESTTELRSKKKRMVNLTIKRPANVPPPEVHPPLPVEFLVVDNPALLKKEDWERVVCVFPEGKDWQFKDWENGWRTPQEIFAKSKGFFYCWSDEPAPAHITQWNVTVVKVSRHNRQKDVTLQMDVWRGIDKEMLSRL